MWLLFGSHRATHWLNQKNYLLFFQGFSRARVNLSNMRANFSRYNFVARVFDFGTAHAERISPITKQQPTNYDY